MFTEVHCIVSGKVQQVAYRDFVQDAAKKWNITGWVKNTKNGTVEILGQGILDDLKQFVEGLHEGSVLAHVETVAVDWRTSSEHFDDFVVIF